MVARSVRDAEVVGSNPVASTRRSESNYLHNQVFWLIFLKDKKEIANVYNAVIPVAFIREKLYNTGK